MIKLLITFFPIIKLIAEFMVKNMNIKEENKQKFFAAIAAVEEERLMVVSLRNSVKEQIDSLKHTETK